MDNEPQNTPDSAAKEQQNESPKVIEQPGESKHLGKKLKSKKAIILLLVVLLVLLGGAAAWWFVLKEDKTTSTESANETSAILDEEEVAIPTTPDTVAYAFKDADSSPFTLYWRLATGGDRTEARTLDANDYPSMSHVVGSSVAVGTDKVLYMSTDSGKTYAAIYTAPAESLLTSVRLSEDGESVIFGEMQAKGEANIVKSADLAGGNLKEVFTSDYAGVFIKGWHKEHEQLVYNEGCFQCDGPPGSAKLRNLKDGQEKELYSVEGFNVNAVTVSHDLKQLLYVKNTHDESLDPDSFAGYYGPPYEVRLVDVAAVSETVLATVGTLGEEVAGGFNYRDIILGFTNSASPQPYYAADKKVYIVKNGTPTAYYETSDDIRNVVYVSEELVIAGSGGDEWALNRYNVTSKETTKIFNGDNNTVLFGVTTK